jgi:hypothetical protein
MTHATRNAILALIFVAVGFALFVVGSAFKVRTDARFLLRDLGALQKSDDPTASFELLKRKYGSGLQPTEGCLPQDCQYLITISNHRISALHLVPYAEMKVWYTVYRGSLIVAMVEYRVALNGANSPVVHVQLGMCAHDCGVRFDVNPHGVSRQMWNGMVDFDTRATRQQRDAAFALNLDCLTSIKRCGDISDLLPTMWSRTGPATVQSRLMGLSQDLEESQRFTSPYE